MQITAERVSRVAERMDNSIWPKIIVTASVGFLLIWGVYSLWFEPPWLSYKNLPFPVKVDVVRPGQKVPLRVVRCSKEKEERLYLLSHNLTNMSTGKNYILISGAVPIKPGCHDETSLANEIPLTFDGEDGTYMVSGVAEISGMIRQYTVKWHSQPFRIERAPK